MWPYAWTASSSLHMLIVLSVCGCYLLCIVYAFLCLVKIESHVRIVVDVYTKYITQASGYNRCYGCPTRANSSKFNWRTHKLQRLLQALLVSIEVLYNHVLNVRNYFCERARHHSLYSRIPLHLTATYFNVGVACRNAVSHTQIQNGGEVNVAIEECLPRENAKEYCLRIPMIIMCLLTMVVPTTKSCTYTWSRTCTVMMSHIVILTYGAHDNASPCKT